MPVSTVATTFGEMLKYLRRRAQLTQRELAIAVGYTEAHVCRLEKNERLPDLATVAALFIPALDLKDEPALMEQLLKLAAQAHTDRQIASITVHQITIEHQVEQALGDLEDIPTPLPYNVLRPAMLQRLSTALAHERCVAVCGMPGAGRTALAAAVAREYQAGPVFWITLAAGVNTSVEAIVRQLALFFLAHGQEQVRPLVERRSDAAPQPLDQQLMLLRAALAQLPALLCFDDVHLLIENETSGSQTGLALLRHLSATTSAALLLTSRQDVPLPVTQIKLGGLEPGEARELAERLGLDPGTGVVKRLLAKTGGNPMLLRLAVGKLLETHAEAETFVEHLETQPQVTSYLLSAVLHDLAPATQWLTALLAVFRQPVDLYDETLVELVEQAGPPGSLEEAIAELQRRHLIDDTCRAALHPLVKDHLYASLAADAPRRKRLHGLAAEWSERAPGDVVEAAYHWVYTGDIARAAEIIADQSEPLFNQGKAQAAVQVVDQALEQLRRKRGDTSSLRRGLLSARGDLLRGSLRAAEAEASYREALALAHDLPSVRAQIVRSLAQLLMQRGQSAEAMHLCQSATAGLAPTDTVLLARLASIECRAHLVLSHYDEAEKTANYALGLADQFAEFLPQLADDVRARAERTLGWVSYTRHPEGIESLAHYRRALAFARRAGLRMIENAVLSNMATALTERGDFEQALQIYQEALKGCEALGDLYATAAILHNLGQTQHLCGEPEVALHWYDRACEIEQAVGDREGLLSTQQCRAALFLEMGKLPEARAVLDHVLAEDTGSSDTWTMGSCLCSLAEVQLLQGEVDAARSTAQRALAMPGIEDNTRIRAWAQSGLALVQLVAGETGAAQVTLAGAPAGDLGFELSSRWQLVQSALARASGDLAGAQALAQTVAQEAERKGLRQIMLPAERMATASSLPVAEMVRLILIGVLNH